MYYYFFTDDKRVATVDAQEKVTDLAYGVSIIRVCAFGNKVESFCRGNVAPVDAVSIKLNKNDFEFLVGKKERLTYRIAPEDTTFKEVEWISGDKEIVAVDRLGRLKGIGAGETEVTVRTNNGIIDICKVKINLVEATEITLYETSLSYEK